MPPIGSEQSPTSELGQGFEPSELAYHIKFDLCLVDLVCSGQFDYLMRELESGMEIPKRRERQNRGPGHCRYER
jgi:hypothetical protein